LFEKLIDQIFFIAGNLIKMLRNLPSQKYQPHWIKSNKL